jgi:peptidoglycan/LPS O-acetylase OafA/YrhL
MPCPDRTVQNVTQLGTAPHQTPVPERAGHTGGAAWRPDIQGLRALAVTLVVLSHAGVRHVAGGYVGVDVFFVISGFLITALLLRELAGKGTIPLVAFYARRALRLLPASTLVVVATLAGAWLFLSKIRFTEYAGDALSSALYAVNLRLAATGTDYLAQGSPPSPFQHFWSLAVEEQFYLLWPALLLLGRKAAGRRGRAWQAAPLAALCAVSFGLSVSVTQNSPSWAYFGPHTRFWELGTGALLAFGVDRLRHLPSALAQAMTWAGLGCVVLAALRFGNGTPYPGYHALLPVLGTALVLAGGCAPGRHGARLLLASRPATWLGGLSYSWYLWHWPLLLIGPMALGRPTSVPLALALGAGALLPAWLTLELIEDPVRFHPALRGRPRRGLRLGLGLSAAAAATALIAAAFPPPVDSGAPAPALRQALTTAPDPQARLTELLGASGDGGLPSNLAPSLARVKESRSAVYRDGCHVDEASTETPSCVYGDRDSDTVVVLFGDSHAAQWFPAMDRLARAHHWRLVSLTKASCKTAAVTIITHGRPYTACDRWRDKAISRIAGLHPALVVVSSSEAGDAAHPTGDPQRQWTQGYRDVLHRLTATGASVATLLDTPWPRADAVDCAAQYPLALSHCTGHTPEAIRDPARRTALRQAAGATGVTVLDPLPWLCAPTGACPVAVGDVFVYRDDSHITDAYADDLAPVLDTRLSPLLSRPAGG